MLASLEDIADYDVSVRPEVLAEVNASVACALCDSEPLSPQSNYAETLAWLDTNDAAAGIQMQSITASELNEIDSGMTGGRSGGDLDEPTQWLDYRQTQVHDSRLHPGYAISVVALQISMATLNQDERDFVANSFVVSICDRCSTALDDDEHLLLRSYVNQWAGGNTDVARAQQQWPDLERIARLTAVAIAAKSATG